MVGVCLHLHTAMLLALRARERERIRGREGERGRKETKSQKEGAENLLWPEKKISFGWEPYGRGGRGDTETERVSLTEEALQRIKRRQWDERGVKWKRQKDEEDGRWIGQTVGREKRGVGDSPGAAFRMSPVGARTPHHVSTPRWQQSTVSQNLQVVKSRSSPDVM